MSGDSVKPDIVTGVGQSNGAEVVTENPERDWIDRVGRAVRKYFTLPRTLEGLTTAGLAWWEWEYDIRKVTTEGNEWGNDYSLFTTGIGKYWAEDFEPLTADPEARFWRDSMGDVLEISGAQFLIQAGIYALQKKTGHKVLNDEQIFWVSLLAPIILKAGHSLGLYSIFGIHDRMDDPAAHMLIGQVAAAGALILAHYSGRRLELRNQLGMSQDANKDNNSRMSEAVNRLAWDGTEDVDMT